MKSDAEPNFLNSQDARHLDNQSRFTDLEKKIDRVTIDTQELLDLFRSAKGGLRILGWMGGLLKWLSAIAASFAAIYAFIQNLKVH